MNIHSRRILLVAAILATAVIAGDRAGGFSYFSYGGVNVVWPTAGSTRELSPSTFPIDSEPEILIRAAMGLWNLAPASTFEYDYINLDQDYPIDNYDGHNDTVAVPASQLDPGTLGVTFLVNIASDWVDMDIFFSDLPEGVGWTMETNPDCDVVSNPTPDNGFSFLLVGTHELGHALGLGHDPIGDEPPGSTWFIQTMNPRYPSGGPVGQENIIELHTDDRNGIRWLYPHSGPSDPPVIDLANAGYTAGPILGKAIPVYFDPPAVTPEEELTVRAVIENFGTTSEFFVRQGFYLSTDEIIDTSDLLIGFAEWDLAFEDAIEFDAVIDMPEDIAAGSYWVGSIFDDLDEIVEEFEDNNAVVYCEQLTVDQLQPVIDLIPQEIVPEGEPYTGPTPALTKPLNMGPAVWTLDAAPAGMTIDPATGVVSWPAPVHSPFLYQIILRATNDGGYGQQQFLLGVTETPSCPADLTGDEQVDINDVFSLLGQWGAGSGPADLTDDGIVDINDVFAMLGAWGPCP